MIAELLFPSPSTRGCLLRPQRPRAACPGWHRGEWLDGLFGPRYHSQALNQRTRRTRPLGSDAQRPKRGAIRDLTRYVGCGIIPGPSARGLPFGTGDGARGPAPLGGGRRRWSGRRAGTLTSWRGAVAGVWSPGDPARRRRSRRRGERRRNHTFPNQFRNRKSPPAFGRGRALVESLILAQDQRWRRA